MSDLSLVFVIGCGSAGERHCGGFLHAGHCRAGGCDANHWLGDGMDRAPNSQTLKFNLAALESARTGMPEEIA